MLTEKEIEEIVTTNENKVSIKELALDKCQRIFDFKNKALFEKHNVDRLKYFSFTMKQK